MYSLETIDLYQAIHFGLRMKLFFQLIKTLFLLLKKVQTTHYASWTLANRMGGTMVLGAHPSSSSTKFSLHFVTNQRPSFLYKWHKNPQWRPFVGTIGEYN